MSKLLLQAKIEELQQQLALAEQEIAVAIGALSVVARADKVIASDVIENGFDKLRSCKIKLLELKALAEDAGP